MPSSLLARCMDDNVLGESLRPCSTDPMTGYERSGYCTAVAGDGGRHHLCAVMTEDFLEYTAAQGNDLTTPRPELGFPGLEAGDRWCVCVPRWVEARAADVAPPVVLDATNEAVLDDVSLDVLREYAHDAEGDDGPDETVR
jgi:hypothetical protein